MLREPTRMKRPRLARPIAPPVRETVRAGALIVLLMQMLSQAAFSDDAAPKIAPLPDVQPPPRQQVDLGRRLFFDKRLSGDATLSCASCHQPQKAFTDGLPLSQGYPGTLYFRNTPTLLNVVHLKRLYWDGRLPANDLPTMVRDHISEAHFFQADGRLVIERIRQVPEYEATFRDVFGGEPTYGRILKSLAAFVASLQSRNVPFDRFLQGEQEALSDAAQRGWELFRGKAGCIQCHHGPMLTDHGFHNLGLAPNPEIFQTPERHITFRRFFRTLGVPNYFNLREDVGLYCISKEQQDQGRFRTPSLREVARTAPYMHDGQLATLDDVITFYNQGGGSRPGRDPLLKPLNLTAAEQKELVAFLRSLSGEPLLIEPPTIPAYQTRRLGEN